MRYHLVSARASIQVGLLFVVTTFLVPLAKAQEDNVAQSDEANSSAAPDSSSESNRLGQKSKEGYYIKLLPEEVSLLEALNSKRYEFGWSGGIVNKFDDQKKSFFNIKPARIERMNRFVILQYESKNGILLARINGLEMSGDWIQDDDTGRFYLKFSDNLETAKGWWHDDWQLGADGKPIKHWAYLRLVKK